MGEKDYVSRNEFGQLDKRVGRTEKDITRHETKIAHIETALKDIKGNTSKILWIIICSIVLAILKMIFKEGML